MKQRQSIFRKLTVLSLEQALVLPYLTYRLAQDGIRVIRLEHPVFCDPNRKIGFQFLPGEDKMHSYYVPYNAGKQAVTLDLKDPRGRELLKKLVVDLKVDIFATNQLPRNYASLGIGYDSLRAVKPDLIWLGITGFGPDSNEAAYDPVLQARSGLMDLTGETDGEPVVMGVPLADMGASEHAYGLLMKALLNRALTGEGQRIDLAMIDSTVSWIPQPITMASSLNYVMTRSGNAHPFFYPVGVFPTLDGYVHVAMGNEQQWQRFVSLPGFQHLAEAGWESNNGRLSDSHELGQRISEATRKFSSSELMEALRAATVPVASVQTIPEVCEDPMVKPKLLHSEDPRTGFKLTLAPPPFMTDFLKETGQTLSFPPRHGEHNEAIFGGELGMSVEAIESLKREGVI